MIDSRIALPRGFKLKIGEKEYCITSEVGRGANSIVYNAEYVDSSGIEHLARVKELYPIYITIYRNSCHEISCDERQLDKYEAAKKRFQSSYKSNAEFRRMYGMVNSTVNVVDMAELNGTIYSVMSLDEGEDYLSYKDESLIETFTHVKTLATVIDKYHEEGFLHLDIKPENVFVIPETAEHILLFDFDSVCRISDLRGKRILDLSFSEGFSAPEQMQGNISKIGPQTDIYALGALLFYKIFDRKPTLADSRYFSRFDYKDMRFYDERLRPAFFTKLKEFFHKTMVVSTLLRWKSVKEVIVALEELIKLADLEATYLIDTFTYNSAYFVGREEELEEIHEELKDNSVLFLSGIGGIGKTELAKRFVARYREEFDTVAFAYFQNSIEYTMCHEILINNMSMEEEESEQEYFERVLEVLRKSTSKRDLILLDNFDVERDDRLEELLQCPCKFLITTRNRNIRDWNFNEVKVDRMTDDKDLMALFASYNEEEYEAAEYEAVRELIDFVDGHTMTVELIAKYLRDSEQSPLELYRNFMEKSGVTNTDDGRIVNQRKDRRMNSESVNRHLSILFDVFNFDEASKEIISSLSLFAGIRIRRLLFEELCARDGVRGYIDILIRRGWIESTGENQKIFLHQVIQDLVYTKLNPTTESCPHIASGIYQYRREPVDDYSVRRIKRRVFEVIADRIGGEDLMYAKICLEYGKREAIEEAIEICKRIGTEEAYSILADLYMEQIKDICRCDDMFDAFETEDSLGEYARRQIASVGNLFDLAIEACEKANSNRQIQTAELARLAKKMDDHMSDLMMNGLFDEVPEADFIYRRITCIFEKVNADFVGCSVSMELKEEVLKNARDFFSDDYTIFRWGDYSDPAKVLFYQELLDEVRNEKNAEENKESAYLVIRPDDHSCSEIGDAYVANGDYEKAIQMYQKAYEEDSESIDWILSRLSMAYLKMGDSNSAVDCLVKVLNFEKQCIASKEGFGHFLGDICLELIKILIDTNRKKEAEGYAEELITYIEPEMQKGDADLWYISYVLAAKWYLYRLAEGAEDKKNYWSECVKLYNRLENTDLCDWVLGFLGDYFEHENVEFKEIPAIIKRVDPGFGKVEQKLRLVEGIIDKYRDMKEFELCHIYLLIICAETLNVHSVEWQERPLEYCIKAQDLLSQYSGETRFPEEREYLRNKIIQVKAEAMSNDYTLDFEEANAVRKQCNYYLVAEQEAQTVNVEKQIYLWKEAADGYGYIDDYENQIRCLEQARMLMLPILNLYDFSRFDYDLWYVMSFLALAWKNILQYEKAKDVIKELYLKTLENYKEKRKESEYLNYLKKIAELYEGTKDAGMAFRGFLIWLYSLLSDKCDERILLRFFDSVRDIETVIQELTAIVSGTPVKEIDEMTEFIEAIERLDLNEQERQLIQPLCDVIVAEYQNKDVEFK